MSTYNILNEKEMDEPISIEECRKLREAINTLTVAPLISKREFVKLMVNIEQIFKRMEDTCRDVEKSKKMNCEGCQCNGCYECSSANCDICCRAEFNDESQEDMYHSSSNKRKAVPFDTFVGCCNYFDSNSDVNNGYGCTHPEQEEKQKGKGCCFCFSCPLGTPADEESFEEPDIDWNGTEKEDVGEDDYIIIASNCEN